MNVPINILLADDDEDDRYLFVEACKEIPVPTTLKIVHDGVQLMEYLTSNEIQLPQLIFLDINMPFKTGLECLAEIKNIDTLKDIPIAILSSSIYEENIEKAYHLGAYLYIQKPYTFTEIRNTLHAVLTIDWQTHPSRINRSKETFRFKLEA